MTEDEAGGAPPRSDSHLLDLFAGLDIVDVSPRSALRPPRPLPRAGALPPEPAAGAPVRLRPGAPVPGGPVSPARVHVMARVRPLVPTDTAPGAMGRRRGWRGGGVRRGRDCDCAPHVVTAGGVAPASILVDGKKITIGAHTFSFEHAL